MYKRPAVNNMTNHTPHTHNIQHTPTPSTLPLRGYFSICTPGNLKDPTVISNLGNNSTDVEATLLSPEHTIIPLSPQGPAHHDHKGVKIPSINWWAPHPRLNPPIHKPA